MRLAAHPQGEMNTKAGFNQRVLPLPQQQHSQPYIPAQIRDCALPTAGQPRMEHWLPKGKGWEFSTATPLFVINTFNVAAAPARKK